MRISHNANWLSSDIHAHIEPQINTLIKVELGEERTINIIKFKMRRNPTSAISETYNINISMFEDGQPEEFLALLNNFSIAIDGTGTTSPSGRINYVSMI